MKPKADKHGWPLTLAEILGLQMERRRLVPRFKSLPAPPESEHE